MLREPRLVPGDLALPFQDAVDQGDHAGGEAGELLGLVVLVEADAGHVEHGAAAAGGEAVADVGADDPGAGLGIVEPAAGLDPLSARVSRKSRVTSG